MTKISDVKEINKILRNEVITHSGVNTNSVMDSLSLYGVNLEKKLQGILTSYELTDSVILFELQNRTSNSDVSFTESNDLSDKIVYITSYRWHIIIYGNSSANLSNVICARMRSAKVRNDLYDKGIFVESVNKPQIINEYINNTMWPRADIDINIGCEMSISPVIPGEYADVFNGLQIETI